MILGGHSCAIGLMMGGPRGRTSILRNDNDMIDVFSRICEVLCLNHGYCRDKCLSSSYCSNRCLFSRYCMDIHMSNSVDTVWAYVCTVATVRTYFAGS